jgi:hypothetical protein
MTKINKLTNFKYRNAGAAVNDNPTVIPSDKTWIIKMIDFTARPGDGGVVTVYWNGTGNPNIRATSQGDKNVVFPSGLELKGDAVKELLVRIDNTDGATRSWMGCIIYYEEHG